MSPESCLAALVARSARLENSWLFWQNPELRRYSGVMAELEGCVAGENPGRRIGPVEQARATARGTQSRGKASPGSAAELAADAFREMPKAAGWAIAWVVKTDETAHDKLFRRLLTLARREASIQPYWPAKVNRQHHIGHRKPSEDYQADLCELALLELHSPSEYQTNADRAAWFGLSWERWRKIMQRPYGALQSQAFAWFGDGCSHVVKRLKKRQAAEYS